MNSALIGYTGFVGSTLSDAHNFTHKYNSKNFRDIAGQKFDLLVCAGISAAKWIANKDPEKDWADIYQLLEVLEQAEVKEFVLISTIDVYPDPGQNLDEDADLESLENHAYGRNRLRLENWVKEHFPKVRIVRLPALFGHGLKKNALYDLLNDNMVGNINPAGVFEWYPVARLWSDINIMRDNDLELVNLFTQSLPMSRIIDSCFPGAPVGEEKHPAPNYRLCTKHAELFGGSGAHIMSADACYEEIRRYVREEQKDQEAKG